MTSSNQPILMICSVWSQISSSLAKCRAVFASNQRVSNGLKKFVLDLVSPAAEKIGWEFKDDEDYLTIQLRKLLLGMAGGAGHEG
jgi:ERAP1-like C-terminal domain